MTARGANAEGQYIGINYKRRREVVLFDVDVYEKFDFTISPTGGLGIADGSSVGVNGACGSGGGSLQYRGGNGTSFSGGAGAGGGLLRDGKYTYGCHWSNSDDGNTRINYTQDQIQGDDTGGQGGVNVVINNASYCAWSGVGAGNPYGTTLMSNKDGASISNSSGTGGLIILLVEGNIKIEGSIQSNGKNGSNGGFSKYNTLIESYTSEGGCGSGGGAIHIFHKKGITGSEKITATGGAGGTGTLRTGIEGGNGTVNIVKF